MFKGLLLTFFLLTQAPEATEPDRKVGTIAVRIVHKGQDLVMTPLLPTSFKLGVLAGNPPADTGVQMCTVYGRTLKTEPPLEATILRCGEAELGVTEVMFVADK